MSTRAGRWRFARVAVATALVAAAVVATFAVVQLVYGPLDGPIDVDPPDRVAAVTRAGCPRSAAELPRFDGYGELLIDGRLPEDFLPGRALRCELHRGAGDSEAQVRYAVAQTTASVTADFLAALRLRDQEFFPGSHSACSLVGRPPMYVILVDRSGRALIPRLPQDPCGDPRDEVGAAIDAMGFADPVAFRFQAPSN